MHTRPYLKIYHSSTTFPIETSVTNQKCHSSPLSGQAEDPRLRDTTSTTELVEVMSAIPVLEELAEEDMSFQVRSHTQRMHRVYA